MSLFVPTSSFKPHFLASKHRIAVSGWSDVDCSSYCWLADFRDELPCRAADDGALSSVVVASRKKEFKAEVQEELERDKKIKMEVNRVKKEDILH